MNDLAHAVFGDGTDGRGGYLEGDPLPGFRNVKLFELQIRIEPTLGDGAKGRDSGGLADHQPG